MKKTLMVLIAMPSSAMAQSGCYGLQTQIELSICAGDEYQQADAELGDAYALAIANARRAGPEHEERLRQAQRAWIPFRDLACEAEGGRRDGGSMEGMVVSFCLSRITRARIDDLLTYVADN